MKSQNNRKRQGKHLATILRKGMMRMKMNYNSWFYRTHAYLQNAGKNGLVDYNDTKYVPMSDRFNKLVELESELFSEQPFGVIANKRGFNKLIDLLEKSNYTIDDINDSLVDAYKHSLTNAMSRMLVNTHAVMFSCMTTDREHVAADRYSKYYIVDIPFNQLHFGDRDEFIRQQIKKMHTTENELYIPLNEFVTSPYVDILGFTLMCCVNGRICNDCKVAIDDKGFKFKIYWPYDHKQCQFIIYKLDTSKVIVTSTTYFDLLNNTGFIPCNCPDANGECCIVNIYDAAYSSTAPSVPNFGTLTKTGLKLINLQQYTLDSFERLKTTNVAVVIYALKYFHEVPNLYPAVNYYDIVDTRKVYDANGDNVIEGDYNTNVYSSSTNDFNELQLCTPPIVLDRSSTTSFSTIVNCLRLRDDMVKNYDVFKNVGLNVASGKVNSNMLDDMKSKMYTVGMNLKKCYKTFIEGALLTSLIDSDRVDAFEKLLKNVDNFVNESTIDNLSQYTDFNVFPELYGIAFVSFTDYILSPFMSGKLEPFADILKTSSNYFIVDNSTRFNRPVSEQCFITMKYDRDNDCWIFDNPKIEHFKGIGNTFYINDDLKGDEIYKFFVLYSDTEGTAEKMTLPFDQEDVFNFDLFYDEVERHYGYIRYWNVENKLLKLCKTIYNEYSTEKSVQVLSKILKRKLDGVDILDNYPTEINYEQSNVTSLNWKKYNEVSDNAPFAVNFLFYTISLMNGNEDQLQAYFYRQLVKRMHSNRYADIDVSSVIDKSYMLPVNYSNITIAPNNIDTNESVLPESPFGETYGYCAIPFFVNANGAVLDNTPYRYTFNVYEDEKRYFQISSSNDYRVDELNDTSYIAYDNIRSYGVETMCYRHDINIARLLTRYLISCYDTISYLQTYYRIPFNTVESCTTFMEDIRSNIAKISSYVSKYAGYFLNPDTVTIASEAVSNGFNYKLFYVGNQIASIRQIKFNGRLKSIESVANDFLSTLKNVYLNVGFDDGVVKRVRNLYLHFKKINELQSIYEFKKWVENIDIEMINNLDRMRSENENDLYVGNQIFSQYAIAFQDYIDPAGRNTVEKIENLKTYINELMSSNYDTHFEPIISYCEDIIENWIFDFYIIDKIEFNKTYSYPTKVYAVSIDIPSNSHTHPKQGHIISEPTTLIFRAIADNESIGYRIKDIAKICEYAFFDGSDMNVTMRILGDHGNVLGTREATIKFFKIGSSADEMVTFNQYPDMKTTKIDIQNIHEEYEINTSRNKDYIVNKKFGKMNYELLIGNSYRQLDHTPELILERKTMLQGSVDRIYLPGYMLNHLTTHEFGQHSSYEVYFKPYQVLHIPIRSSFLESVGGKYFPGQTLYLRTDDRKYIFPIIVTAVDMSESNGFVEAVVDQMNAKWFKITNIQTIKRYMENAIPCTVIDDNICNFLDEYTHSSYGVYQIPEYPRMFDPSSEDNVDEYSMPGDPLFVTSNAPYVYTRLEWIFNQDVPNRYMDSNPQNHHMIYVGSTDSLDSNANIKIKLINHSFDDMTNPEKYPILRQEPDDHSIWDEELRVFNEAYRKCLGDVANMDHSIGKAWQAWYMLPNKTIEMYQEFKLYIEDMESKRDRVKAKSERLYQYIKQLETPTTWYNVRTYETAIKYIDNGRAYLDFGHITNVRNIPFTDKLKVYIYDWEHHNWIDPALYTTEVEELTSTIIGEWDEYRTRYVKDVVSIIKEDGFPVSKDLIIYFAYDKSDVFDSVEINDKVCDVRFKPLLNLDSAVTNYDPYTRINIRKQFDGHEKYIFDDYSEIPNFSKQGYLIKRPELSGKRVGTPNIRFIDLTATNDGNDLTFDDFDLYLKIPFKETTSSDKYLVPNYVVDIIQPIDGFVENQTVKLICISNNSQSSYDGNISTIMFDAYATMENDNQQLRIVNSTLPSFITGSFTCTVFKDNMYPHSGGLINVSIVPDEYDVVDDNWIKATFVDALPYYKILPKEFVLVPKDDTTSGEMIIDFKTEYLKSTTDYNITIKDDGNIYNPYLFYYNTNTDTRYPIGEVRKNEHTKRLVIDKTLNPDVTVVKNTFISICRYACQKIPKDGIIDMTGYLPTPLTRDHYEFWVNGRCIKDVDSVKILSPTSIQLINLKSLRNFECVELIDDYDDSILSTKGSVYIDLNGKTYASYTLAANSGKGVFSQNIRYMFNANNQQPMQTHTISIISNPNNKNLEKDILESVQFQSETPTYYEELFNIPSINGVDIYDPMSYHLGLIETENKKILEMFDRVWRREQCTNRLFPTTHMSELNLVNGERITLHSKYSTLDKMYVLYATGISDKFFTFYITKTSTAPIDDTTNTLKIIPFIRTGVFVYVDKSLQGRWLCCTHPDVKPIKIM